MKKRTLAIINELLANRDMCTITGLAEKFSVSQRTIRNDLNDISGILRENGKEELTLAGGGKILCAEDFESIRQFTAEEDLYSYKLSKEERIRIAAAFLVNSSEYITLSTIAENLFVSRATVINDLNEIKDYIAEGNLEVFSHPNKGLRVEGKESDKRLFLMRLSSEYVKSEHADMAGNIVQKQISVQAGNRITLQKILIEQEHIHSNFLTDDSFDKILLYLGIMMNRNLQGEYIEVRRKNQTNKYLMAQDILKYISQYCHTNTTEDEVQFLSELLGMARYFRNASNKKDALKVQTLTRLLIEQISDELGINLNDDYEFFENLSNHLTSILSEAKISYPDNPVIEEVLEENPEVLKASEKVSDTIKKYTGRDFTKEDAAYVAVHVCAALERRKNKEIAFHVIVACHAGVGTSQLLLEKLKKHFNFQIVDIVSSHEAKTLEKGRADFIITTVPLEGCQLDYVVVSPLLSDEDYIRVGNKIDTLRNSRNLPSRIEEQELTAKGMIEKLSPIIYDAVPEAADMLMKKVRKAVREYFRQPVEADTDIFAPYLHHLLPASHITLDVECTDWKEAVRAAGEKLLEKGYIEARYIDAMIANIEENGPYVVISPGFAVPHEGLEMGSVKVGMHLIRLKHPVPFGVEEFDPVEFVCCLSAVDHKTHLKAFFNLINLLQNQGFRQALHICETSQEAAMLIERYEYETE